MTAFARVTDIHDAIALTLTPCAGQLYRWLLRRTPAGKAQELELAAFAHWSKDHRGRPYSIRHIQRALQELIDSGLIAIIKRYTARIFKLICHHPNPTDNSSSFSDKKVQIRDEKVQAVTEMSKIEHSKPHGSVPIYRDSRETTDTPTSLHPVSWTDKEGQSDFPQHPNLENAGVGLKDSEESRTSPPINHDFWDMPLSSEEIKNEIDEQLQAEIEEVITPQPLNQNIRRVVFNATVAVVKDALAVVRQQKKAGRAKRPAGMLVKAIQEHWTPNPIDESTHSMPDGFSDWFDLARAKGIVTASMPIDGQMCVCTDPEQGDWQPWTELAFAFPKRILKEMNPIKFFQST